MTEDYKKDLIDYATGNLQSGTPTTDEIIKELIELNRNDWNKENILPSRWQNFHYEGIIKDNNSDKIILYGGYRASNSSGIDNEVYGIITILDNNCIPLKSIFKYDNGTPLRYIQTMEQAEDGTFYMLDDTNFAYSKNQTTENSTKRIVLLNNFISSLDGEYKLILRSSYIVPSSYKGFKCLDLKKNPNQAQYIMVIAPYYYISSGTTVVNSFSGIAVIEFVINYGSPNTWNKTDIVKFNNSSQATFENLISFTDLIMFSQDKYSIKLVGIYLHYNNGLVYEIKYYYKDYESSTYNSIVLNTMTGQDIVFPYGNYILENQGIFLNDNEVFFVNQNISPLTNMNNVKAKITLYYYNISNNNLITIYDNVYGIKGQDTIPNNPEIITLEKNEGKLYIQQIINNQNNTGNYYYQRFEGTWNPILIGENKLLNWDQRNMYVNNNFNLLKIFLYPNNPRSATWYFPVIKEVYNPTNYNGEPYESSDVLVPKLSNLYSGQSLIFSRNLYNITKQNNQTMSSVEIPNTYLNDVEVNQTDLISKTNVKLNSDTSTWNKNIYEVVDVNFINTISVIDEDTNTPYLESAIKLNNATTDGGDANYTNTPCNKARINYTDETTKIISVNWSSIDDTHKETLITFYVDKEINSIDLISNDETTIYLNIPVEVEVGKYYSISQKIRIE